MRVCFLELSVVLLGTDARLQTREIKLIAYVIGDDVHSHTAPKLWSTHSAESSNIFLFMSSVVLLSVVLLFCGILELEWSPLAPFFVSGVTLEKSNTTDSNTIFSIFYCILLWKAVWAIISIICIDNMHIFSFKV